MVLESLQKTDINYSFLDQNTLAYSQVSKKDQKPGLTFEMVLRPRACQIIRKIKHFKGSTTSYSPIKDSQNVKRFALHDVSNKVPKTNKVKKFLPTQKKASYETPYQFYRRQLTQTPSSLNNPFNATPSSEIRRSKRLSQLRSATNCTPSANGIISLAGRKRKLIMDESKSKLSPFSSGLKTLVANSSKLSKAITHIDENQIACKKPRVNIKDAATKPTGWCYSPMLNSYDKKAKGFPNSQTNKSDPCVSLRRRLSVRLRKKSATKEPKAQQSLEKVENVLGVRQLRGRYNQALYYDG